MLKRLRRKLPPVRVTFAMEGKPGTIRPWAVRAGYLVVATTWNHDERHLHLTLRSEKGGRRA